MLPNSIKKMQLNVPLAQALTLLVLCLVPQAVMAQNSSLLRQPAATANRGSQRQILQPLPSTARTVSTPLAGTQSTGDAAELPAMLDRVSWTYQPPPQLRRFSINDIVTIRVDEITRMMAEGRADSRKRTLYEAILSEWIRLTDFRLKPDPQVDGDPSVATESNNQFRSESSIESRESLSFNVAATVVDIRPNGNLVLEARKTVRVNDNLWETSLSGICRAEDIAPDNVVLSRDLIDLEIRKEDQGHMRDGYRRGWFSRWFDRLQPF